MHIQVTESQQMAGFTEDGVEVREKFSGDFCRLIDLNSLGLEMVGFLLGQTFNVSKVEKR